MTAPISPGNSDGGLFDDNGRLIGITTLKAKGGEKINFAIDAVHIERFWRATTAADYLRTYAEYGGVSAEAQAALKSPRFAAWLLRARTSDGRPVLEEFEANERQHLDSSAGMASQRLDRALSSHMHIVRRYVTEQTGLTRPTAAATAASAKQAATLLLNCQLASRLSDGGPQYQMDHTYAVDSTKSSVDGLPATISEALVSWVGPEPNVRTVIDRYSGSITVSETSRGHALLYGKCVSVTERRF